MERQQQQQDSSDEPKKMYKNKYKKKMYKYEDSEDERKNTYENEEDTMPIQLWGEVWTVINDDDVERLEWLLLTLHSNLNDERFKNTTPLTHASWLGRSHSVEKLLEWAADVNREDGWGNQPIYEAAWAGSIDCLDLLIFHVDRSNRDYQRKLILTTNAWKGRGEPTKYLVPYNHFRGDIDVRNRRGRTALHSIMTKIDVVHYLLNLGADVNAKDSGKQTPLHSQLAVRDRLMGDQQHQQKIFHLWFEGADVNARDDENQTPLNTARKRYRNCKARERYRKRKEIETKSLDSRKLVRDDGVRMMKFLFEDKKKHESLHRNVETLRNEITDKSLSKLSRRTKEIRIARTIDKLSKLKLTDPFRYDDYMLEHYTTYFLNKLKRDTDYLVFHSRFSENKEHVDEWFEDEEF